MHEIGAVISQSRQNQKMTQEEFAARLGVTPQAVSRWECGIGMPDISLVEGICRILQISVNRLLGFSGQRVVENNDDALEKEICSNLFAEPLSIEIGSGLIPCFAEGTKTDLVNRERRKLVGETGMLVPLLRIRDREELGALEICIRCYDRILLQTQLERVDGTTYETVVKMVFEQCRQHYDEVLNKQLVKTLVDQLKEQYPGVADGLVPERISYLTLERCLQERVRTQGNIRDMIHILEELESQLVAED